jgi:CheY-like chemotaxis protein
MMLRRSFLCNAFLGAAGLVAMPAVLAPRRPSLWIADSEPCVAFAVQLLARHCGFADARIFASNAIAIKRLRTEAIKPALLVTDYLSGRMGGNEFMQLARHASPATKLILFSATLGTIEEWIAVAGLSAPRPDAIVEKPNARKLMPVLVKCDDHHLH